MRFFRKSPGGFEVSRVATLIFEDPRFAGAEVEVDTLVTVGELFAMRRTSASLDEEGDDISPAFPLLLRHVRSWNLELDGRPVPLTPEGMACLPHELVALIMNGWRRAVVELPDPLGKQPESGPGSAETESTPQPE